MLGRGTELGVKLRKPLIYLSKPVWPRIPFAEQVLELAVEQNAPNLK